MKRLLLSLAVLVGTLTIPALPASASWVGNNCYNNNHSDSNYRRVDARAYVQRALGEGYEYGGGCWNDNNSDDTPGQPDSGGEGPDCSGLVFKAWELLNAYGDNGFRWWDKLQNIHGPYSSDTFHNVSSTWSGPFFHIDKRNALYMDALARLGHVGLLWSPVINSSGTSTFAEAKGDSYKTNLFEETWISNSDYLGTRRRDWTADCYPNCLAASAPVAAVVVVRR